MLSLGQAGSFKSTYLEPSKREVEKQWMFERAGKRNKIRARWVFLAGVLIGVLGSILRIGLEVFTYYRDLGKYCLVLEDNFDGPLNTSLWKHEVSVGGFGNGEFSWTTANPRNAFTEDGNLYIVPTFTADDIGEQNVLNGYTVNLTADGTCTTPEYNFPTINKNIPMQIALNSTHTNCQARSNSTLGTVIPPIQSARLNTNGTASIRYGRVEFRAKMPKGDWIWPAIWMLPEESVYGIWPASGEIDIVESTGTAPKTRYAAEANIARTSFHFGYDEASNKYLTLPWQGVRRLWRKYFYDDFHVFGLEWSEKEIWSWEGTRNRRIVTKKFDKFPIDRFPIQRDANGIAIPPPNPWASSPNKSAPFDQNFYLILNIAVGSLNGYFDNPFWSYVDPNAARTFWQERKNTWAPTWSTDPKERGLAIDYIKMWQRCG